MALFIKRVPRDDKMIDELEKEVFSFLTEMDEKLEKLEEKYNGL
jgi:hypothetical protein